MIVIDSQYLPCIASLASMASATKVVIDQHEHYQRKSYRNRCHIANSHGLLRLSIPLQGGKNQRCAMKDVHISYEEDWQKQHWASLFSAYNRSPFFEFYADELETYYKTPVKSLVEWNMQLLRFLFLHYNIHVPIECSTFYIEPASTIDDLRQAFSPKEFYQTKPYTQLFADRYAFLTNLSAIDLLFHQGPQAIQYLKIVS